MPHLDDNRVRLATFHWLEHQVSIHGDVLPPSLLQAGFELDGQRIPLVAPSGIFKPKVLAEIPLSITTTPGGPYSDRIDSSGRIFYSYRGTDPTHRDNVGLRKAMMRRIPLVYFYGVVPAQYLAVWPVFIVDDRPEALTFSVQVDDRSVLDFPRPVEFEAAEPSTESLRAYITAVVQKRMHQRGFRERVLKAYRDRCAFCRLRHRELLDAAHIVPDDEPAGEPVVSNGLALCKLHHAAFDRFFVAVRPDLVLEVRRDLLEEHDGPMLIHGLQQLHGRRIQIPRPPGARPDPELLERRYERFLDSA